MTLPWILMAWLGIASAFAQDYARERRWAEEIVPAIVVGDPVYLTLANNHRFLNLYTETLGAKTAVLLVHGIGVHPDHGVIGILRTKLADLGYTTLAVQMPVQASEAANADAYYPAVFPQAGERIAVAAKFLQDKGYAKLVLLSHSMGAWMSNVYLIDTPSLPFDAWICMGLGGGYRGASKIKLPVLDVYGENDLEAARGGAKSRASALVHIPKSEQLMIPGADHFYTGRESELAQVIDRFIKRSLP